MKSRAKINQSLTRIESCDVTSYFIGAKRKCDGVNNFKGLRVIVNGKEATVHYYLSEDCLSPSQNGNVSWAWIMTTTPISFHRA